MHRLFCSKKTLSTRRAHHALQCRLIMARKEHTTAYVCVLCLDAVQDFAVELRVIGRSIKNHMLGATNLWSEVIIVTLGVDEIFRPAMVKI